jgi:hypothetical protein
MMKGQLRSRRITKDERAIEITENILGSTVIAESVQITYLGSSSSDDTGSECTSEDDDAEMKGFAMKTEVSRLPGENKWSVAIRERGQGKTFEVKERDLLGPNYIIEQTYNNASAEQRQRMLAKGKRKHQAESRKKELELAELAKGKDGAPVNRGNLKTYLQSCSLEEHTHSKISAPSSTKSESPSPLNSTTATSQ